MKTKFILAIIFFVLTSLHAQYAQTKSVVPQIVKIIPHDQNAFTQGLEYRNGKLYESTGLYDKSSLRVLDTNGIILKNTPVNKVFAEGCTIFGKKLYQLTWKENKCFVYSFPDLVLKKTLTYDGEGWGLANDNKNLLMSNGSDTIFIRDSTFKIIKKIQVKLNGTSVRNLNELEFASGKLYANIWYENVIAEIDISTGSVLRLIDCRNIIDKESPKSLEHVLNGIAFRESDGLFYITGKNWMHIYLVRI